MGWLLPWLVLVLSLMATYLVWQSERQNTLVNLKYDFDFRVRETHARIHDRLKAYEQILRGAKALFMASESVKPEEFRAYVKSLKLDENYPGSHGIGFVEIVSPAQRIMHEKEKRAAGISEYAIRPEGKREIYAPVSMIEPFAGNNRRIVGTDFYTDSVRRTAMEISRDTNKAVNSGRVILPPDEHENVRDETGFLMFQPLYRKGAPITTLQERKENIAGWVYVPFHTMDLMTGILGELATEIDIEIHDGTEISDETMMFDPDISGAGGNPHAIYKNTTTLEVAQHEWTVVMFSLPGFETRLDKEKQNFVAYVGIEMSLLLTILAWLLVQGRARAVQFAETINHELAERKRAEEGLMLAATVVKTVEEAVIVTNQDNLILAVNPAFTEITGYTLDEVEGKDPKILASGRHSKEFYKGMWESLLDSGSWHGEIWDRRKSGENYIKWLSIKVVRDAAGKVTHYIGVFADISERKAAEERMQYLAHHDMLTGLPNRTLFSDRLQQGLVQAKRDKVHLALMFLDLDKFKPINDTYGHAVGDLLLQEVALRLQKCVRESDTVSRIGGDEFVVLLRSIEVEQDAKLVAEKMLNLLQQSFELKGHSLNISVSIGIAVYPEHGGDERALTRNADIAMYYAKASGRNNAKLFQPDMSATGAHCVFDPETFIPEQP